MPISIVSRALSDSTKRLSVANAQVARVLSFGTSWSRIRVGFHYGLTDSGGNLGSTPRFWLGLLSSPSVDG